LIDETTAVTRFIFPYNTDTEFDQLRFYPRAFVKSMILLAKASSRLDVGKWPEQRVHIWQAAADEEDETEIEE